MTNFPYYMLCMWTVVIVGRPQDIFTFLEPLNIGDIAAGLTTISYFWAGQHGPAMRHYPETRLFFVFVGYAILCIPFGYYPGRGVEFLIYFGVKTGLYLWFIAKLVTTEERIQGLAKAIMLSGFLMAVSVLSKTALGERMGIGAYDPNDLALLLVTTLPIAVMQCLSSTKWYWKTICFLGSAFNLIAIIATQSRGGFLGLVALGAFMLSVKIPRISRQKLLILLTVLAFVFLAYLGADYKDRIVTILEESTSDVTGGSGRIGLWRQCLVIAKDHPILGVGPDAFSTAFGDYLEKDKFEGELAAEERGHKWQTAHNAFLLVLIEMGIPGLLIFVAIIIRSYRNLNTVRTLSFQHDAITNLGIQATGLQMALIGFLACALFLSQSYSPLIYLFCFLSGTMLRISSTPKQAETPNY